MSCTICLIFLVTMVVLDAYVMPPVAVFGSLKGTALHQIASGSYPHGESGVLQRDESSSPQEVLNDDTTTMHTIADDVIPIAMSRMATLMDPAFVEMCLSSSSPFSRVKQVLFDYSAKVVDVKPSTIPGAGSGLFCSQHNHAVIKAGTIVSWYPVHAMGINFRGNADSSENNTSIFISSIADKDWNFTESTYRLNMLGKRPLLDWELSDKSMMFVDANPERPVSPSWCAHFINDGSIIAENNVESILAYHEEALERLNVAILPVGPCPLLAAVTTRDIKPGEELFTGYGYSYWMRRFDKEIWVPKTEEILSYEQRVVRIMLGAGDMLESNYHEEARALTEIFDNL